MFDQVQDCTPVCSHWVLLLFMDLNHRTPTDKVNFRNYTAVPSCSSPWGTLRKDSTFPNQRVPWTNVSQRLENAVWMSWFKGWDSDGWCWMLGTFKTYTTSSKTGSPVIDYWGLMTWVKLHYKCAMFTSFITSLHCNWVFELWLSIISILLHSIWSASVKCHKLS